MLVIDKEGLIAMKPVENSCGYKKKITPVHTAAISAFICGCATHLFGLVSVLHNYDDIAVQPSGYGTGVTSGRWLLSILGDFCAALGGNYNLHLVNGVLFLLLLGVTAGVLVSALQIRSKLLAAFAGAMLAVFPSAFSTLTFRYTSVYYALGLLFSTLAAWVLHRNRWGLLLSALCTACSLGIYQAYVPVTITIFVLVLIRESLKDENTFGKVLRQGLYCCCALVLGLVFYSVLLQITLKLYGTQLSDYQGINEMGKMTLSTLLSLIKEAYYTFLTLPIWDYCGLASRWIIKAEYLLLGGMTAVLILALWVKGRKPFSSILMTGLLLLVFPLAVNFIVVMCPDSWIYTIMVYSFALIPCLPIVLLDHLLTETDCSGKSKDVTVKVFCVVLAAMILCYAYQTNVNYYALYFVNRQVENYMTSLVVQVRMTEGFRSDMQWVAVGEMEDPLLHSPWQYEMNYGGTESASRLVRNYSWPDWIQHYYGYSISLLDEAGTDAIARTEEVENMPCWPDQGSIRIIADKVVIKFQDLQ